jgi:uncharacterized protein YcfL
MKNTFVALFISLILLVGCVSPETKTTIENQAARSDNIVGKIERGETTRTEEQSYIKAMRVVWWAVNHDVNDAELPADVVELLTKLGLLNPEGD